MNGIDKGTRVTNFIIDILFIGIIYTVVAILINRFTGISTLFYVCYFLYYLILETFMGRTLGKMFTKTTVVNSKGVKPGFFRIFLRTMFRFAPIDYMSYLCGYELGAHDIWSRTRLTKMK